VERAGTLVAVFSLVAVSRGPIPAAAVPVSVESIQPSQE